MGPFNIASLTRQTRDGRKSGFAVVTIDQNRLEFRLDARAPMPSMDRKHGPARLSWDAMFSKVRNLLPFPSSDARLIKTLPWPAVADIRAEWKE